MPVYEQKLISPLAIRFTQEHIRTTFQDGRVVEDSVDLITASPASADSDYDLILQAPFPAIEILRWRHGDASEHWFTLDNRRLYCLQRAAMAHWPKRVAAEVDILYTDSGHARRKCDTTTQGRSVSIGNSCKGPEVDFWDWFMAAEASYPSEEISQAPACLAAIRDDQCTRVEDLAQEQEAETDAMSSMLAQLVRMEAQCDATAAPPNVRCRTPSTSAADSDEASGDEADASDAEGQFNMLQTAQNYLLRGVWHGNLGETYTFASKATMEGEWSCSRCDTSGTSKAFSISYDWDYDLIWWGKNGTYFASVEELAANPCVLQWYAAQDVNMRKPKFSWQFGEASADYADKALVQQALAEITASLKETPGYVWVSNWQDRYGRKGLGSIKNFLESHPGTFVVKPKRGANAFSVWLAESKVGGGKKAERAKA